MLDAETRAFIPEWKKMKDAQWERFQGAIPGLQLVKSGDFQNQFMLVCSIDETERRPGFYEGIIIGQLPQVLTEVAGPRSRIGDKAARRPVPEHRKPLGMRAIDLSDEEIAQVIERWATGRSALGLEFIPMVWGRDGKRRTARNGTGE